MREFLMDKFGLVSLPETAELKLMNCFKNNLNLNNEDIEKLSIGITVILFNLFEMSLVFAAALLSGVIKETIVFSVTFVILRMFAAGVHCKTGHACLITTLAFYLGSSLLSKYCTVEIPIAFAVCILCSGILCKYAPADTENRPIIGREYRLKLKISLMIILYSILLINLLLGNTIAFNCVMYAVIIQSISVMPVTYKVFKVRYENYKLYE